MWWAERGLYGDRLQPGATGRPRGNLQLGLHPGFSSPVGRGLQALVLHLPANPSHDRPGTSPSTPQIRPHGGISNTNHAAQHSIPTLESGGGGREWGPLACPGSQGGRQRDSWGRPALLAPLSVGPAAGGQALWPWNRVCSAGRGASWRLRDWPSLALSVLSVPWLHGWTSSSSPA